MLKQTLSILVAIVCLAPSVFATTFFVKEGGTGEGTSWKDASGNLRHILTQASSGDEVWVAGGTYFPTQCANCNPFDRSISFYLPEGVKLLGGFRGKENRQWKRDWKKHPTILSGNIGQDGFSDNSYTVIYTENVSEKTVIDGFIIRDGNADNGSAAPGHPSRSGGGWYNDGSGYGMRSNPFLMNCVLMNNRAVEGAGMFNNGDGGEANPIISACVFTDNQATFGGGALFNNGRSGKSVPSLSDCQFVDNYAAFGAGIFNACPKDDVEPSIDRCTFANNKAERGSGLFYLGLSYRPALRTNRFLNNQSKTGADVFVMKGREMPQEFLADLR